MTDNEYTVATASQLRGSVIDGIPGVDIVDHAVKQSSGQLGKRSTARNGMLLTSTCRHEDHHALKKRIRDFEESVEHSADRQPLLDIDKPNQPETLQLLKPVCYAPPDLTPRRDKASNHTDSKAGRGSSTKPTTIRRFSRFMQSLDVDSGPSQTPDPSISTKSSNASNRGRQGGDIYFTPVNDSTSRIYLSNPIPSLGDSPTLPMDNFGKAETSPDSEALTSNASLSRPPSAIYLGPIEQEEIPNRNSTFRKHEKLTVGAEQLNQLVAGLAKCRMVQSDIRRNWWIGDDEYIPEDNESDLSSLDSLSTPILTSASTLYSHPNDIFLNNALTIDKDPALATRLPADPDLPFGGVALADHSIYGSPVRFVSKDYRVGKYVLPVGACSHVEIPYGSEVECNLRIEPPASKEGRCHVMLQCTNQVVDRYTGKKAHLLVAEVDVTEWLVKAALAELAETTGTALSDIVLDTNTVVAEDTPRIESPDVDWLALADSLQAAATLVDMVETTSQALSLLSRESCTMATLSLLSELRRVKDQHQDFLVLQPTGHHENGVPTGMRLPWISLRLWKDWYGGQEEVGWGSVAKRFRERVVETVTKRVAATELHIGPSGFTGRVEWRKGEDVVVKYVPLFDGGAKSEVWVCFIRGMYV